MSNVVCDTAKGDQQAAASPSFCKRKVQLLAPNQQGPAAIGSFQLTCLAASLGLLLLGFLYYLSYRDQIPVLLTWLGMRPHVLPTFFAPNPLSGSLPSFIHVAAFTLLTCALSDRASLWHSPPARLGSASIFFGSFPVSTIKHGLTSCIRTQDQRACRCGARMMYGTSRPPLSAPPLPQSSFCILCDRLSTKV
jgi:hypothetical protein